MHIREGSNVENWENIEGRRTMRRLICCEYHEDSESVELRYTDGTLVDIDCLGVED